MRSGRLHCTPYYPLFLLFFMPAPVVISGLRLPPVPKPLGIYVFLGSLSLLLFLKYRVFRRNLRGETERPARLFVLSNILSTLYGMFLSAFMMSPLFLILVLPLLAAILKPVSKLLVAASGRDDLPEPLMRAMLLLATATGTLFFFAIMNRNVMEWADPSSFYIYWIAKVLFFTLGAGIFLLFSAWIELAAMRHLSGTADDPWEKWGDAVLRANAAVFLLFLSFAAACTLPERLGAPHGLLPYPDSFPLENRLFH